MMETVEINTKGIKGTAASRLAFDDLKVGSLVNGLGSAAERFAEESENLRSARESYADVQLSLTDLTNELTSKIIDEYYASATKPTQAELDRVTKRVLHEDETHQAAVNLVAARKAELDDAQHEYDVAKVNHRTLASQANLVAATLNFLGASKTARSAALQHLNEL